MNKFTLLAMAVAVATSGAAFAQRGPMPDPYGDATVSKADFLKKAGERFDQFDTNHDGKLSAEEKQRFAERTALGRWGQPAELAGPALLLASDAGSYITGTVLVVDGGTLCNTF